ncbi:MAG: chemotaxis protein, partial [Deltaproteobacteria bacterium HGW-Deltaproteobacteria-21]
VCSRTSPHTIRKSFPFRKRQDGYDLEEGDLWKYSVSSALISRELAEKRKMDNSHLVFTAALLKDIGKVVLSQYVADSFEKINLLVTQYGYSFMEAEKAVIGIDHAELGGLVAEKWGYSPKMVEIIRSHHLTDESTEFDLETSIVYLADTLCMMIGVGVGSDGLAYRFRKDVIDKLGFSDRDFQEVMAGFGEKLRKVEELIHA